MCISRTQAPRARANLTGHIIFTVQENGEAAMQAVADGLEDAARILTEMEREWSR
jgi:hypothetical protein